MTETLLISFDPGKVTGVAAGSFTETTPLQVLDFQVLTYDEVLESFEDMRRINPEADWVISEYMEVRTNNEFVADLHGKKVEGILDLAFDQRVEYRPRTKKEQVPDQVIKDAGWWQEGSDVDWEDGRDVNDAINHLLGFVAFDLRHRPTLGAYFRD